MSSNGGTVIDCRSILFGEVVPLDLLVPWWIGMESNCTSMSLKMAGKQEPCTITYKPLNWQN